MGSLSKTKNKNFPKCIKEMSKDLLQETLQKKKECNEKALNIVEKLCEPCIDEDWFLANLQFINQCHFNDIITERAITHICGYPLCDQQLGNIPTQQYHISTRYNKIFDITERKNFCSSCCYKSAIFVKKQLFTSPLWFRDQEVIPKYTVLKSSKSSLGEEVFFSGKVKVESDGVIKGNTSSKAESFIQSDTDLGEKCSNLKIDFKKVLPDCKNSKTTGNTGTSSEENTVINLGINSGVIQENKKNKKEENIKSCKTLGSNVYNNNISENSQFGNTKNPKTECKIKDKPIDAFQKIEKSVFEWFSLETLFYLFGEEKLKELLCDKVDEIKQLLKLKLSVIGPRDKVSRMIELFTMLDTDFCYTNEIKADLKPLPNYEELKKENQAVEIKIKAFYQGQFEIKPHAEEKEKEEETNNEKEIFYLPLIDSHSQIYHRRKIFLDRLHKVLPDLMKVLGSNYNLQINEIRNLVATFTLAAHNITFKPSEWYLIGIIIIKLLSLKDKHLESVIKLKFSESQILLILTSFKLEKDYLDKLVIRLTDSKNIITKLNEINR